MQQTKEATTEAEAQRGRAFRFVEQGGVVQAQLAKRVTEVFIVVRADREQTGVNLWLHFFKAWQRFVCRVTRLRQGIANRRAEDVFNRTNQPTYLAAFQLGTVNLFWREDPQAVGVIDLTGAHYFNFVAFTHGAVFNTYQRHHAKVVVEPGVDDQRL